MQGTISQHLNLLSNHADGTRLKEVLDAIGDTISTTSLMSAALVIKAGGSTLAKTGAVPYYALADGVRIKKAAATDMAALSGTVVNATFNVFCFYVDSAGTLTSAMGKAGATLAAVVYPTRPQKKALIGWVEINPTGTGDFVGGTTALDDATVIPGAVFVSVVGGWDPSVKI